jgi:HTH-type transcriptional regulator/antitoxin HigA
MENIKIIKTDEQYYHYCKMLEQLESNNNPNQETLDRIELLHLLIEKYDTEHFELPSLNPVEYLIMLMDSNNVKARDIQEATGINKTTLSHFINYRRALSKNNIRRLADYFKVTQEVFNRKYELRKQETRENQEKKTEKV